MSFMNALRRRFNEKSIESEESEEVEEEEVQREGIGKPIWNLLFGLQGCGVRILLAVLASLILSIIVSLSINAVFGLLVLFVFGIPALLIIRYTVRQWKGWREVEQEPEIEKHDKETNLAKGPWFNVYEIDCAFGSGWIPPFTNPVSIEPPFIDLGDQDNEYLEETRLMCNGYNIPACYIKTLFEEQAVNDVNDFVCFNIVLPEKQELAFHQMEQFWVSIQSFKHPVSFEIISNGDMGRVIFQFLCHPEKQEQIRHQLTSIFPDSFFGSEENNIDYLTVWEEAHPRLDYIFLVSWLGLEKYYAYPLPTLTKFDTKDPLIGILSTFAEIQKNEAAVFQALVQPVKQNWKKQLQGETFRDGMPAAQEKGEHPLFAICLRLAILGDNEHSTESVLQTYARNVRNDLSNYGDATANKIGIELRLIPGGESKHIYEGISRKPFIRYTNEIRVDNEYRAIFDRTTHRHGFILNSKELTSLCHFPSKNLQHPKLLRQQSGLVKAPDQFIVPDELDRPSGVIVGVNCGFKPEETVFIPDEFRAQHAYIVGKTRQGKSVLMANMIIQDIQKGNGVGVIDPHGALIREWILPRIPKERKDDVILFDPADEEYPIGFNMFHAETRLERRLVKNDIVVAFRRLFQDSSWGDNIATIIRTTVDTLLADNSRIYSLLDVVNMINDEGFRYEVVERILDPFGALRNFWLELYPSYQASTIGALKRRLFDVLGDPLIGNILGQQETTFNLRDAMDNRKIFLASLSKGILGEHISNVFGGLLVSKIQLTALARAARSTEDLVPFYFYVDEFQNFTNESFTEILSESSKYKLYLTVAHQFASQLPTLIRDAIIGNVGTWFVFNSSHKDGRAIDGELADGITADDIVKLPRFHTFTRIGTARNTFTMATILPPDPNETHAKPQEIIAASRAKYCREQADAPIAAEEDDDEFTF